jgi:hypothetical protein
MHHKKEAVPFNGTDEITTNYRKRISHPQQSRETENDFNHSLSVLF